METNDKIKQSIRTLIYDKLKANFYVCNVTDVDEVNHICNAETIVGDEKIGIPNIKLNTDPNDSFTIIPAVDSTIFVIMTTNKEYYMVGWGDIDKIICIIDNNISLIIDSNGFVFNDGNNGGIINISNLTDKLNQLKTEINTQLKLIQTAITGLGGTYPEVDVSAFSKSDYEDTNITH